MTNPYITAIDGYKTWGASVKSSPIYKKITYHRQFSVDRAALNGNAWLPDAQDSSKPLVDVSDFSWYYHQFHVKKNAKHGVEEAKSVKVGEIKNKNSMRERLSSQMALNTRGLTAERIKYALNISGKGQSYNQRSQMAKRVKNFTGLNLLVDQLLSGGYIDQKVYDLLKAILSEPIT